MKRKLLTIALVLMMMSMFAQTNNDTTKAQQDISFDMDLESLMNMEVTTASKKAQNIDQAPAAVTVVTKEDLMFYGVTNLGEALRLVPGMEIIQGSDANYEISVRGFSRTGYNTSNKVLWLVDGRSAYFDAMGGFRMESCPIAIDDIERIEVIRGSGSALYGANAYSGVVNIITKKATEDGLHGSVIAKYGNLNQVNTSANITGRKNKLSYKLTLGYNNIDQAKGRFDDILKGKTAAEQVAIKDSLYSYGFLEGTKTLSSSIFGNMALNYSLGEDKNIKFTGGFSDNKADVFLVVPGEAKALDFFAQIDYNDKKNTFRAFYNSMLNYEYTQSKFLRTFEDSIVGVNGEKLIGVHNKRKFTNRTMDFEYQRNITISDKLSAIAGASFRGNFLSSGVFAIDGSIPEKQQQIIAAFLQAEYHPVEQLNIIAGGRFDNHSEVGNNFNPKLAAVYSLSKKQTLRASWGTATRNPNFFENYLDVYFQAKRFSDLGIPATFDPVNNLGYSTPNVIFNVNGSTDLKPEKISSFELGYILNVNPKLQMKLDAFYNEVSNPIEFGNTSIKDAFIGSTSTLQNVHDINPAFATDLSALAPYNNNIDPTIPNSLTKDEMIAQIAELTTLGNNLITAGQTAEGTQLLQLAGGLTQVSGIYNYNLPRVMNLPIINGSNKYQNYGAEVSFTYVPSANITLTGSYSYLDFSDNYKKNDIFAFANGSANDSIVADKELSLTKSSKHKAYLGVKFKIKSFYIGTTFTYMSEVQQAADNNRNGKYDTNDIDNYENKGIYTIDPRMNLNLNIGYQTKFVDIFVGGYNLIQSDYQQFYHTNTISGSDLLSTRFMGGVKVKF